MNLLTETMDFLEQCNKNPSDVRWIGSTSYGYFDWEYFSKIANIDYDNGFGGQEVASDLKIVGDNWWFERHEYDGSEWWEYKSLPNKPDQLKYPKTLVGNSWSSLTEMNDEQP